MLGFIWLRMWGFICLRISQLHDCKYRRYAYKCRTFMTTNVADMITSVADIWLRFHMLSSDFTLFHMCFLFFAYDFTLIAHDFTWFIKKSMILYVCWSIVQSILVDVGPSLAFKTDPKSMKHKIHSNNNPTSGRFCVGVARQVGPSWSKLEPPLPFVQSKWGGPVWFTPLFCCLFCPGLVCPA